MATDKGHGWPSFGGKAVDEVATPGYGDCWVSRAHLVCVLVASVLRYLEGDGVQIFPCEWAGHTWQIS